MSQPITPDDVIDFWFSERVKPFWFKKSLEFDREIKQRFLDTYQLAKTGALDNWRNDSDAALALIIVLDQFPRNMFRDTPQAFATDSKAIELTKYAVENNYQRNLSSEQQAFLYMPLMHSENQIDQAQCVELFQKLGREDNLKFAIKHQEIVDRFGRFLNGALRHECAIVFLRKTGTQSVRPASTAHSRRASLRRDLAWFASLWDFEGEANASSRRRRRSAPFGGCASVSLQVGEPAQTGR